jgi:hypothetical protein
MVRVYPSSYIPVLAGTKGELVKTRALVVKEARKYEIVVERHGRASTIVTSSREVGEWESLFDDPILAKSALDRITHNAYQLIIEGESYRTRYHRLSKDPENEDSRT